MDDRRSFEDDTAAKQRLTGAPSVRQFLVLVGVTAFVSAFAIGFLDLEIVPRFVLTFTVMVVVTVVGTAVLRRANLRRHRQLLPTTRERGCVVASRSPALRVTGGQDRRRGVRRSGVRQATIRSRVWRVDPPTLYHCGKPVGTPRPVPKEHTCARQASGEQQQPSE